jgi:hypothetical protein
MVAAAVLSVLWGGCVIEEEPEERTRFDDEGQTAQTGTGSGAGGLQTTVSVGMGGAGASGSGGSSTSVTTGSGAGGPGCNYDSPNSCLSADTITEIAGDAGTDVRVVKGTTSRFVKVFVAETVGSVISYPDLKFVARLDNSPNMDFDLNVYVADTEPHCNGELVTATSDPAVVAGSWGDSLNSDDGKWMVFEVFHAGGSACGQDAEWTLTIAGNHQVNCNTDGTCGDDDDCACPDCDSDPSCMAPGSCDDDGTCDTANEGCGCTDCTGTPVCL